ncbi:hypothetical protein IG197_27730 [Aminobacter sp. SR38]|jgi:hypothetical protein|uniref:hypothetical protein n=1 Tax=Aminobacter sp. SR38 TaxID=2774562 RepID=UPI00177B7935|nr:hypothetical protein [Aminobacter sp. SR38]QOF71485.1 hypothetical protein IG197_27730 [Aminobacter sp. SR38]
MNGRIVITGTGRAGTTLLVQLLTHLGEDTGFTSDLSKGYFEKARAGLEWHLSDYPNLPGIIKGPHFCDQIDQMLSLGMTINHVIIPVRNFADAAASRRHVQHATVGSANGWGAPGGLWGTERGADQEAVIRRKFTTLMESLVRNDIPATFIAFPRLTEDPEYLFGKLLHAFPHLERDAFDKSFKAVVRPEIVHHKFDDPEPARVASTAQVSIRDQRKKPSAAEAAAYVSTLISSGYVVLPKP